MCTGAASPGPCTRPQNATTTDHQLHRVPLAHIVGALCAALPVSPTEIKVLELEHCRFPTLAIEARLASPTASDVEPIRIPQRVYAYRPIEIVLAPVGRVWDLSTAESVARCISTHGRLSLDIPGWTSRASLSVPVYVRPSDGGWIARALTHPAAWADAASVTVHSMSFAGRSLPCDCLPSTLQGSYNHAPAPEGAVYAAAQAGNVQALQAALDAGGSTEDTDGVSNEL